MHKLIFMNGWKIDTDWLDVLERDVRNGIGQTCEEAAQAALVRAREGAPEDSGALKVSGYIKTSRKSGYSEAATRARALLSQEGATQAEILPEWGAGFQGIGRRDFAWAAIDFPVSYAPLIINGFHHIGSGQFIPGNPFVTRAVAKGESAFDVALQAVLDRACEAATRRARRR